MYLLFGEQVEKIYEYETAQKKQEKVYVTDRRLVLENETGSLGATYDKIEKTERKVRCYPSGGSVFFTLLFLFALACGITAFCYGWFEEEYYLCVGGVAIALFGVIVGIPFALKMRRKEYGLCLTVQGKILWLDTGDKKLTELLAGEIAVKTPNNKD